MHFLCWTRPAAKYELRGDDVILAGQQPVANKSKPAVKSSKDSAQINAGKGSQESSDVGHQLSKLQHTLASAGQHLQHASITSQGGGSKHLTIATGGDASPRSPNPPGFSHIPGRPSLASMSPHHQQNSGAFSTVTSLQTTTSRQGPIQALAHSDVTITPSRSGQMGHDIDAMSELSDPGEYEHYGGDSGDEVEAVAYEGAKVTPAGSVMGEEDRISCASPGCFAPRNSKLTLMSTVAASRRATADEPQGPPTAEPHVPANPAYSMRRRSDSLHKTPQAAGDSRTSGSSSQNNTSAFMSTAAKRKSSSGGSRASQSGRQASRSGSQRQTSNKDRTSAGGEAVNRTSTPAAKPGTVSGQQTTTIDTPERTSNRTSAVSTKDRTSPPAATVLTPDRDSKQAPMPFHDRTSPQQAGTITIPDLDARNSPAVPSLQSVESGSVAHDRLSPKLATTPSHVSQNSSSSGRMRAATGLYREPTRSSANRRSASFSPEVGESRPLASMNAAWSSSLRSSSTTPTHAGALRGRQPQSSQYAGRTLSPAVKAQTKAPQETERKQPMTSPCVRRPAVPDRTTITTRPSLDVTSASKPTATKATVKPTSVNVTRSSTTAEKLKQARPLSPGPSPSTISYSNTRASSASNARSAPSPANARRGNMAAAGKGKKEPEPVAAPPPGPIVPAITSVNSPLTGGELPVGAWRMVRLQKSAPCDACNGTTLQETVDGSAEVFQCDQVLNAGALAVVICHTKAGCLEPKTWVFCPDPLCLGSKPTGSCFTKWPTKITLAQGTKITRSEYANLKELGLDVAAPQAPGSQPPSQPASRQYAVPVATPQQQPTAAV